MQVWWQMIPEGDAGTAATLARMRTLVDQGQRQPYVVTMARQITESARDDAGRVNALTDWIFRHYRFQKDPLQYELLVEPARLLQDATRDGFFQGDCDDVTTLAATLAEALGVESRFRVMAPDRGDFSHVVVEFLLPEGWTPVDFTVSDAPLGWAPRGVRQAVSRGGPLMPYHVPMPNGSRLGYYRGGARRLGQVVEAPVPAGPAETSWMQQITGAVTETAQAVLPLLERYGVLEPERGPYRLPLPGEPAALYAARGYFPPAVSEAAAAAARQAVTWGPILLIGGGLLVVFMLTRGRRR